MKFMLINGSLNPLMDVLIPFFKKEFHIFALDSSPSIVDKYKGDRDVTPFVYDSTNEVRLNQIRTKIVKMTREIDVMINFIDEVLIGSLLEIDSKKINSLFDKNLLSVHRINKAFFEMVKIGHGRIINVNNNEVKFNNVPFCSSYQSLKKCFIDYNNSLRVEANRFGVDVILINTSFIKQGPSSNTNISLGRMQNESKIYTDEVKYLKELLINNNNNKGSIDKCVKLLKKVVMDKQVKKVYSLNNNRFKYLIYYLPLTVQENFFKKRLFKEVTLDKDTLLLIKDSKKKKANLLPPLILNKGATRSIEAGIEGEDVVYKLLRKYTKRVYRNIVILKKNATFFSEIDFVCFINNRLILIEAKNWYGKLENTRFHNKVRVSCINTKGKFTTTVRDDPYMNLVYFLKDFSKYLTHSGESITSKDNIYHYVVFTKDELNISPYQIKHPSEFGQVGKLDQFETFIKTLKNSKSTSSAVSISDDFPTWDIGYDHENKTWHHIVLLGEFIEVDNKRMETSKIQFVHLKNDSNINIVLYDNTIIQGKLTKDLEINKHINIINTGIRFIRLNRVLHSK